MVESHPHSETREEKIEAVITTTSPPTAEQEVKKKAKKDKKNKLKAEKSAGMSTFETIKSWGSCYSWLIGC